MRIKHVNWEAVSYVGGCSLVGTILGNAAMFTILSIADMYDELDEVEVAEEKIERPIRLTKAEIVEQSPIRMWLPPEHEMY